MFLVIFPLPKYSLYVVIIRLWSPVFRLYKLTLYCIIDFTDPLIPSVLLVFSKDYLVKSRRGTGKGECVLLIEVDVKER